MFTREEVTGLVSGLKPRFFCRFFRTFREQFALSKGRATWWNRLKYSRYFFSYTNWILNERVVTWVRSLRCHKVTGLTLVYVGRQAWWPVRSRRSWRSFDLTGTCCPASDPDGRLSESGCTPHRPPFVSCSNALPVPWLCHGTSARASSSGEEETENERSLLHLS